MSEHAARPVLRLGTRGSALALAQSGTVAAALRAQGVAVEIVTLRTAGDERPPDTAWGEGAFVGALEQALLAGTVDLAVHSAKDVPTAEDPRLCIAAYPGRADPHDALVCRDPRTTLDTLPSGARVGTDSPRRTAFVRARRPDLQVHPLHGNVDTRLRRLDAGETDALVLAVAGLARLRLVDRIAEVLPADVIPPAPGQGALAVQCRAADASTVRSLERLDDPATRTAVETERAFLRATGGGCRAPVGALAEIDEDSVVLHAGIAAAEPEAEGVAAPTHVAWGIERGPTADRGLVATRLAGRLVRALGARDAVTGAGSPVPRPRVLVTRTRRQAAGLIAALQDAELEPVAVPTIDVRPVPPGGELDDAVRRLGTYDWIVVTSQNGAAAVAEAIGRLGIDRTAAQWVAVGPSTARALARRSVRVAFAPKRAAGEAIALELDVRPGQRILLARGDLADAALPDALRERGATVDAVVAYRTTVAPETSRAPLQQAFADGPFDAIVLTSGSTAEGLLRLLSPTDRRSALRTPAVCIGPLTARAARGAGFDDVTEARRPAARALAQAVRLVVARQPRGSGPLEPAREGAVA